jgi:hypothetical protein
MKNKCSSSPIKAKKRRITNNSKSLEYFTDDISITNKTLPIILTPNSPPPPSLFTLLLNSNDDNTNNVDFDLKFDAKNGSSQISLDQKLNVINDDVLLNKQDEQEEFNRDANNLILPKDFNLNLLGLEVKQEHEEEEEDLKNLVSFSSTNESSPVNLGCEKLKKLQEKLDKRMMACEKRREKKQRENELKRCRPKAIKETSSTRKNTNLKQLEEISSNSSLNSDLSLFFDLNRFRKTKPPNHYKTKSKSNYNIKKEPQTVTANTFYGDSGTVNFLEHQFNSFILNNNNNNYNNLPFTNETSQMNLDYYNGNSNENDSIFNMEPQSNIDSSQDFFIGNENAIACSHHTNGEFENFEFDMKNFSMNLEEL